MSNVVKKYKLDEIKGLGVKKSGPVLGDAYGVTNAFLKEGDTENAEAVANTVAFTLSEVEDYLTELMAVYEPGDAIAVLRGDLIKERALFFEIGAFIQAREDNEK